MPGARRSSSGTSSAPSVTGAKSTAVINSAAKQTINSPDPVVVLTAEIELDTPSKLLIEGVLNGAFQHVMGLALYIDDEPANRGTGTNTCHEDTFQVQFGNGGVNFMQPVPYQTVTEELPAGTHTIKIGVIGRWAGVSRAIYLNDRSANGMPSTSSLIVRKL